MKLHIQYLRSLEESERVRKACLTYMQNWYHNFYPERPDIVAELQGMAARTAGSPGGAPLALEVCLDEAAVWMESGKMGSGGTSAVQGVMLQVLRQGNVQARGRRHPWKPASRRTVSSDKRLAKCRQTRRLKIAQTH